MSDALAFCRRRLDMAVEHTGDLAHAAALLRDDDAEAEHAWADARALDLRGRDLEPHKVAADQHHRMLHAALDSGRGALASLDEAVRAEAAVVRLLAAARAETQAAVAATADARRDLDAAQLSIHDAEREVAEAGRMVKGL